MIQIIFKNKVYREMYLSLNSGACLAVVDIEIFSGGGGQDALWTDKIFCHYTRSMTSYIILGRKGEALLPLLQMA